MGGRTRRSGLRVLLLLLARWGPLALWLFLVLFLHVTLLALLELLRLLSVFLLHLPHLLLLAALELFLPLPIRPLPFQFLLFLDVPLLDLLALHILLLAHLFHFSVLLLLQTRIEARSIWGPRGGWTVFEGAPVIRGRFARTICFPRVFGRTIWGDRSASFHRAVAMELARPRTSGNVWTTVIHRCQQSTVAARGLLMLGLLGGH